MSGTLMGGHAPVVGAHVYLLQPSVTSYGGVASSILGNNGATSAGGYALHTNPATGGDPNVPAGYQYVITDSSGDFSFTGAYNCTSAYPVYAYAYGGNATGGTTTNTAIVQLAILGNCPTVGNDNFGVGSQYPISFIYMNEVSTVAAAYVFQPFTLASNSSAMNIGSSGTTQALLGIENAALTAAQLYSIQGTTQVSSPVDGEGHLANFQTQNSGVPNQGNGVVPQATIDTLANILASCVDSTGSTSASCTTLFANATDNGLTTGTNPTDTATAAINIARYPAGNYSGAISPTNFVTNIYGLATGTVPYTPHLAHQPNDFTIVINYPETAVSGYASAINPFLGRAESIAVDALGELWITAQTLDNIVRYSPLGVQNSFASSGYIYGYVSIDGSSNAWAGNANSTSGIEEFNSNGVLTNTYGSGYNKAYTVVSNQAGDAFFVANTTGTGNNYQLFEYGPGGTPLSEYSISPNPITARDNVAHGAIDASGDLWLTTESSYQIARVTPTGGSVFTPIVTAQQPEFPSIDGAGRAWIAVQRTAGEVYVVPEDGIGATVLNSGNTGAEMTSTFGSAVDGNGNVWFANRSGNYASVSGVAGTNSIFELSGTTGAAISPPTNYYPEAQYPATATTFTKILNDSLNLAIDPSGNVWITNYLGNSVAEMVGAAAPVVTPLSVAAGTNKLGVKP